MDGPLSIRANSTKGRKNAEVNLSVFRTNQYLNVFYVYHTRRGQGQVHFSMHCGQLEVMPSSINE